MKAYIAVDAAWEIGLPDLEIEIDLQFDPNQEEKNDIAYALEYCFKGIYRRNIQVDFEDEKTKYISKEEEIFSQQGGI